MILDHTSNLAIKISESTGVVHWRSQKDGVLLPQLLKQFEQLEGFDLSESNLRQLFDLGSLYSEKTRIESWDFFCSDQKAGTYVRLHTKPRRYSLENIDWESRILFKNSDYLIFNKPGGLPCHPMVDNYKENLAIGLQNYLKQPVYVTHRLDVGTRGLILFALNQAFQKHFNSMLSNRLVCKKYRLWLNGNAPFSDGEIITHYMHASPWAPKKLESKDFPGALRCDLRILNCKSNIVEVELLTGRTHQIRAQMAYLGYPLFGDTVYGPCNSDKPEENSVLGLMAFYLEFIEPSTDLQRQFTLD